MAVESYLLVLVLEQWKKHVQLCSNVVQGNRSNVVQGRPELVIFTLETLQGLTLLVFLSNRQASLTLFLSTLFKESCIVITKPDTVISECMADGFFAHLYKRIFFASKPRMADLSSELWNSVKATMFPLLYLPTGCWIQWNEESSFGHWNLECIGTCNHLVGLGQSRFSFFQEATNMRSNTGQIDVGRTTVAFGHQFGGSLVINACQSDHCCGCKVRGE